MLDIRVPVETGHLSVAEPRVHRASLDEVASHVQPHATPSMIEGLTFKVLHDASPEATPAEGHCNMNACQLGDPVGKKPRSAAAHRFSFGDSGDQKPGGKDEVVARLVSKNGIDFGRRSRPPQYRPTISSQYDRRACCPTSDEGSTVIRVGRRCEAGTARSLTPERAVARTIGSIDLRWANFGKVADRAVSPWLPLRSSGRSKERRTAGHSAAA